jgi:cephalosporin-C deacetylase-like acetyl esterase
MVSPDPEATVAGMTQAVLDIRRAAAWLAAREEVDSNNLGIFGISLGGITGALAATAEPRLQNVCLMLAGGDLETITKESTEFTRHRDRWIADGRDTEKALATIRAVDPVTYAANARGRRILMLNATDDTVIPRASTLALWEGFGRPPIRWYKGNHYSVIWRLFKGLHDVSAFFAAAAAP